MTTWCNSPLNERRYKGHSQHRGQLLTRLAGITEAPQETITQERVYSLLLFSQPLLPHPTSKWRGEASVRQCKALPACLLPGDPERRGLRRETARFCYDVTLSLKSLLLLKTPFSKTVVSIGGKNGVKSRLANCATEHSAAVEMFCICAVQYGGVGHIWLPNT